jgi:hypothetical protein
MALDKRITTIGVFNPAPHSGKSSKGGKGKGGVSGIGPLLGKGKGGMGNGGLPRGNIPDGSEIKVPTFFFLGGPSDFSSAKARIYIQNVSCTLI